MTIRKAFLFLIILILCSCQSKEKAYEPSYNEDKMIGVLIDLYTAEAAIKDLQPKLKDSLITLYKDQIETIHKVDMGLIEKDLQDLQVRPGLYKSLHEKVQDSIALLEKSYNKKKEKKITKSEKKTIVSEDDGFKELPVQGTQSQ